MSRESVFHHRLYSNFYFECTQTLHTCMLSTFMNPKQMLLENIRCSLSPADIKLVHLSLGDWQDKPYPTAQGMVGNKEQSTLYKRESQPLLCKGIAVTLLRFKPTHAHVHKNY